MEIDKLRIGKCKAAVDVKEKQDDKQLDNTPMRS
jgi:hypothetical protein